MNDIFDEYCTVASIGREQTTNHLWTVPPFVRSKTRLLRLAWAVDGRLYDPPTGGRHLLAIATAIERTSRPTATVVYRRLGSGETVHTFRTSQRWYGANRIDLPGEPLAGFVERGLLNHDRDSDIDRFTNDELPTELTDEIHDSSGGLPIGGLALIPGKNRTEIQGVEVVLPRRFRTDIEEVQPDDRRSPLVRLKRLG